jgi:small subunit ribosomal protein S9
MSEKNYTQTVGRRKTAAARVRMSTGTGTITVNGKDYKQYFPISLWSDKVTAPLKAAGKEKNFDISVKVAGGGVLGQAEAVRHGIARGLLEIDEALRSVLKVEGFLTRDARAKERKKFGRRKARRGRQWRKR